MTLVGWRCTAGDAGTGLASSLVPIVATNRRGPPMRVIALEEHYTTAMLPAVGTMRRPDIGPKLEDLGAGRLADMDAAGIDLQVLSPSSPGTFLDDLAFSPVFACAESLGVPVYLHPTPPTPAVFDAYFSGLPGCTGEVLAGAAWGWHAETGLHALRLVLGGSSTASRGSRW
ncbi:MAG: hypothetical protein M0Z40_14160 [Actinomycetota bacterium]|nr:hypothetical protein [Actinomycetota bacterium]